MKEMKSALVIIGAIAIFVVLFVLMANVMHGSPEF